MCAPESLALGFSHSGGSIRAQKPSSVPVLLGHTCKWPWVSESRYKFLRREVVMMVPHWAGQQKLCFFSMFWTARIRNLGGIRRVVVWVQGICLFLKEKKWEGRTDIPSYLRYYSLWITPSWDSPQEKFVTSSLLSRSSLSNSPPSFLIKPISHDWANCVFFSLFPSSLNWCPIYTSWPSILDLDETVPHGTLNLAFWVAIEGPDDISQPATTSFQCPCSHSWESANPQHPHFWKSDFTFLKIYIRLGLSILAWRTPWTEKLGGLQSTGRKESDTTERLHFHFHFLFPVVRR